MAPSRVHQASIKGFLKPRNACHNIRGDKIAIKKCKTWAYIEYSWQNEKQQQARSEAATGQPTPEATASPSANGGSVPLQTANVLTSSHAEIADPILHDRSLTDMLMETQESVNTNNPDALATQVQLEAQLMAAFIRIDGLLVDNTSLNNQINLLNDELENYKKTLNSQKSNIKRLTVANDTLRKELSQYRGMRRHTQGAIDTTAVQAQDTEDTAHIKADLAVTRAKLSSLRDQMVGITSSMLSLLEDDSSPDTENGFQLVTRRRHKRRSNSTENPSVTHQTLAATTPRHQQPHGCRDPPPHINGQQIAVVTGVGKPSAAPPQPSSHPPSYSDIVSHRRRPAADTYVIGTSLTRGLGTRLQQQGIDGTVFTYPGATIPHIRSRLRHILSPNNQPREIVLQCGGNDLETQSSDKVSHQYDCLIEDVRKRCPNSVIITSNVPPRRRSTSTLRKIDALNSHLSRKIDCDGKITNIDVCPSMPAYFSRDQVHFNKRGADLYASKLAQSLVNFSWYRMREMM